MKTLQIIKKHGIQLPQYQERIIKELDKIESGRNCTIVYRKDCTNSLTKEAKQQISKVEKISIMPLRKGIDYSRQKNVIEKRQKEIIKWGFYKTKKCSHIKLDNNFAKHNTEEQYYLLFYPQSNKNAKPISEYIINGDDKKPYTSDQIKEMGILKDAYWNEMERKQKTVPSFYKLKIEGVIAIM